MPTLRAYDRRKESTTIFRRVRRRKNIERLNDGEKEKREKKCEKKREKGEREREIKPGIHDSFCWFITNEKRAKACTSISETIPITTINLSDSVAACAQCPGQFIDRYMNIFNLIYTFYFIWCFCYMHTHTHGVLMGALGINVISNFLAAAAAAAVVVVAVFLFQYLPITKQLYSISIRSGKMSGRWCSLLLCCRHTVDSNISFLRCDEVRKVKHVHCTMYTYKRCDCYRLNQ